VGFAACDGDDSSGSSANDGGVDGGVVDGGSGDGGSGDSASGDGGSGDGGSGDGESGADAKPVSLGRLVISVPATVIGEDATNPVVLPAPNGAMQAIALSPNGRIILIEPSSTPSVNSLVSVLPDGTGRIVLVDASTFTDAVNISLIAVAPNDTVYYGVSRGASFDYHLGSIKSDGTAAVAPVQLTGGATGHDNVSFVGAVAGNDVVVQARYKNRIFTNDSGLLFTEYSGGVALRLRAMAPNLTASTILELTPGLYESVCGVTRDGRAIYARLRSPGGSVADVYSVNVDGTGNVALNPSTLTTVYSCMVTPAGRVLIRTNDPTTGFDLLLAQGGALVPLATTVDREAFLGDAADGRIVFQAEDNATSAISLHVVDATGTAMTTLSPKTDAAGAYGGLIALTPGGRAIFARATLFGGALSIHSVLLDGTGRLDLVPEGKFRADEELGATASGRLVYRGDDQFGSPRLYSMRTDALLPGGGPNQVVLSNNPNARLSLLLD
jgi:hypothetical protein